MVFFGGGWRIQVFFYSISSKTHIELPNNTQLKSVKPFGDGKVFMNAKSYEDYDYVSQM